MGKSGSGSDLLAFWVELDEGDLVPKWCKVTGLAFVTEDTKGVISLSCQPHHRIFGRGQVIYPNSSQRLHLVQVSTVLRSGFFSAVSKLFHLQLSLLVNRKLCPHRCLFNHPDTWLENSGKRRFKSVLGLEGDKLFFAFNALALCLPFSVFSAACYAFNG